MVDGEGGELWVLGKEVAYEVRELDDVGQVAGELPMPWVPGQQSRKNGEYRRRTVGWKVNRVGG